MSTPQTLVYAIPGVPSQFMQSQQGMTSPAQIIVLPAPSSPVGMSSIQKGCFVGLGATQLAVGCLCVLFNIIAIVVDTSLTMIVAPGIWCGIVFILAGSFGIAGGKKKRKCMVVTFLVLSIISSVASCVVCGVAGASISGDQDYWDYYYDNDNQGARITMDALLIVFGFTELVIAIVSSAICCGALCCRQQLSAGALQHGYPTYPQTYVTLPGAVIPQPAFAGANLPVTYPVQPWLSSHMPQLAAASFSQPQGATGDQEVSSNQDLADVHRASAPQKSVADPPSFNPSSTDVEQP